MMKKISWINYSLPNYGADETTKFYHQEALRRGYASQFNVIDESIDFYIIGMFYHEHEVQLKKYLKAKKYIYIEHSIEQILPEKQWIRDQLMPNSYRNLFFSPRHRQHIEDAYHGKYKHLAKNNISYIVVPIDYDFFKPMPNIIRRNNYYLFCGYVHSNKGVLDILKVAEKNPQNKYTIAGTCEGGDIDIEKFKAFPNVRYVGHKNKNELLVLYSNHKYIMLIPNNGAVESAGRTVLEGILCGCEPIVNSDVGNASYPWWKDKNEIIKHIKQSNDFLFELIESGIRA